MHQTSETPNEFTGNGADFLILSELAQCLLHPNGLSTGVIMSLNLDSYFGIHAKALAVRDQRASQLANNLANINTPNYKAQDIDFNELLSAKMATNGQQLQTTSEQHINPTTEFATNLKYRTPMHTSLDGNTVDKDMETAEFARNSLNYQASLSFLDGKIKSMMTALKGE